MNTTEENMAALNIFCANMLKNMGLGTDPNACRPCSSDPKTIFR